MEKVPPDHWKIFLKDVYNLLSGYEFQKDRSIYNVRNLEDWGKKDKPNGISIYENLPKFLSILQTYNIDVEHVNKSSNFEDFTKMRELNIVLQSTLKQSPQIRQCWNDASPAFIQGNFVTLSDISLQDCSPSIKSLEILASDTVFIDADLNFNYNLTIMAPKWSIIGKRTIKLDVAPRSNSGSFFGIGDTFINGQNLTIIPNRDRSGTVSVVCCGVDAELIENANTNGLPVNKETYRKYIDNFKKYLITRRPMEITKSQIESFLKKLITDAKVNNFFGLDGLLSEYKILESHFRSYSNHIDLFPFYNDLLKVIHEQSVESVPDDHKTVLFHLYTSVLTNLNIKEKNSINTGIVVKTERHLHEVAERFKYLQKHEPEIIHEYQNIKNDQINKLVKTRKKFIKKYVIEELEQKTNQQERGLNEILKMVGHILDCLADIGIKFNEILSKTNEVSKSLYLGDFPSVNTNDEFVAVKNLTKTLLEVIRTDDDNEDRLVDHKTSIRESVVKLVEQIQNRIELFDQSSPNFDVTEFHVAKILRRIKFHIKQIASEFQKKNHASNTLEALNFMIDVYDRIDSYYTQKKVSDYLKLLVTSSETWISKIEDANLANSVRMLRKDVILNLILGRYENEVSSTSIRQFAFPYVDSFYKEFRLPKMLLSRTNVTDLLESSANKIESLIYSLYRALNPIDQYIMISNVYDYKYPFFIWDHTKYKTSFSRLFAGKEISLKADLGQSTQTSHHNGIRFNGIEVHFKAINKTNQKMIDDELNHYHIWLTHTGNSYYRCDKKVYLVTTSEAPMVYSHERNTDGKRVLRNGAYTLIHEGDAILSPFTTWKLKLLKGPYRKSYNHLSNFEEMVDLQLVGKETYLEDEPFVCNRNIDDYYELDEPMSSPNNRLKRDIAYYATSASSSISSPLNNVFNWMSSTLASSIGRITYLGSFASKPVEMLQEHYISPMEFFDQINSLLVLAPLLLCLGRSYFKQQSRIIRDSGHAKQLQPSRIKICSIFIDTLQAILVKYNFELEWVLVNLEDRRDEIELIEKDSDEMDFLETRLVTLLVDFLDDIAYDSVFERVKFDKNFLFDVNNLIAIAQNIPNFANKYKSL